MLFRVLNYVKDEISWAKYFLEKYKNDNIKMHWIDMLKAYVHGQDTEIYRILSIDFKNRKKFIHEKKYRRAHPINGHFSSIIDNKLYLPYLFKNFPEHVPEYYFFIDKGRLVDLRIQSAPATIEDFFSLLMLKKKCALKHIGLSGGEGFYVLEVEGEEIFLNKKCISKDELFSFIRSLDNCIVTEYVQQAEYSSRINQSSANTIRFLCLFDFEKDEFFIPISFHRFGTQGGAVDNMCSRHACLVYIDVYSGRTENYGIIRNENAELVIQENIIHPDSSQSICNFDIPNYVTVRDRVLEIMNTLSFLKYAGVDIVITNSGFKIIEINSYPGLYTMMSSREFCRDERIKKFYSRYGLL